MAYLAYDLHVHSCLSPCGDDESTPNSIAGMAKLQGLDVVALTDHNSVKNCRAFFTACARYGVVPIAGMELTTAEDIHLLCLFPTLAAAEAFGEEVEKRRVRIKNRPAIFGNQLIVDDSDEVIGQEEDLLINATTLTLEEGTALVRKLGGAAIPAHIEREANGILAMLGALPEKPDFPTVELADGEKLSELAEANGLHERMVIVDSDAHNLWSMNEAEHLLDIPASRADGEAVAKALIKHLRGGEKA